MTHDPNERLIEIATAAKRFMDVAAVGVHAVVSGSGVLGAPAGVPVVQLSGYAWPGILTGLALDGAEYRLSHGNCDGREYTHLFVEVMHAWIWTEIDRDLVFRLLGGEMEKAPAV